MAATDKDVLRPAQISTNYQAGARALVIAAEGFDSVTDNGVVGMSNEIVGSVRCVLAGRVPWVTFPPLEDVLLESTAIADCLCTSCFFSGPSRMDPSVATASARG